MNDIPLPDEEQRAILETRKLRAEIEKLIVETSRLRSETSPLGSLGRIVWPLLSGVVALVVSLVSLRISSQAQHSNIEQERKKIFFSALQMATDTKGGDDARIAGIWSLVDYWHDQEYSVITANALSAILSTDADSNSSASVLRTQQLRQEAADVIGRAIIDTTPEHESERLRILLYGDSRKGWQGTITRYQQTLVTLKAALLLQQKDITEVERKLQATREAIRQNWENLQFSLFADHDLTGIDLYEARLQGTYFGNATLRFANLCGANLSRATFNGADLSFADLAGADLSSSIGWSDVKSLAGANIAGVKNAPADFLAATEKFKSVQRPYKEWREYLHSIRQEPPATAVYTNCDHYK